MPTPLISSQEQASSLIAQASSFSDKSGESYNFQSTSKDTLDSYQLLEMEMAEIYLQKNHQGLGYIFIHTILVLMFFSENISLAIPFGGWALLPVIFSSLWFFYLTQKQSFEQTQKAYERHILRLKKVYQ